MAEIDVPVSASLYTPPISLCALRLVPGGPWSEGDHFWQGNIGGTDMAYVRGLYGVVEHVGEGWGHTIGYRDYFGTYDFDEYIPWLWQVVTFGATIGGPNLPTGITNVPYKNWLVPLVFADLTALAVHVEPTVTIQLAVLYLPPG